MNESTCWISALIIIWIVPLILMVVSGEPDPEKEHLWKDPEKFDFVTCGLVGSIMLGILYIMRFF